MFVSPRFRDLLGSDPSTAYLSELSAAAARIDPFAGESDEAVRHEPSRSRLAEARPDTGQACAPVFIPAPVYNSEFIPAAED